MGDYSAFSTGNNRPSPHRRFGRRQQVLEWKPRFIAVALVLIAVAVVAGFVELDTIINNWEW